jgi:hypothetical protein
LRTISSAARVRTGRWRQAGHFAVEDLAFLVLAVLVISDQDVPVVVLLKGASVEPSTHAHMPGLLVSTVRRSAFWPVRVIFGAVFLTSSASGSASSMSETEAKVSTVPSSSGERRDCGP